MSVTKHGGSSAGSPNDQDFGETFTLVVKPVKIRTVVALVAGR
jgi:hypothetical protein